MKQRKQWFGLALALLLVGVIGLVATHYAVAETGDMAAYDEDEECEFDGEEALYDEIDALYDENEDAFFELEEGLERLYEELDSLVETGSDSQIADVVRQIYLAHAELEALEEQTGIADLYEQLHELYAGEEAEE